MRQIGFSTGALAHSDFELGLKVLKGKGTRAVELSALRENELAPLIGALDSLDLTEFAYISVHAPSRYQRTQERDIIGLLQSVIKRRWPIVVHPDAIYDFAIWNALGGSILIENMDKRNEVGRTVRELAQLFAKLPRAGLCFDGGHCRQVDPTMNESYLVLTEFRARLKQLHLSEVNTRSTHDPLSSGAISAFEKIAHLIPEDVPVILETPVQASEIEAEIEAARLALPNTPGTENRKPLRHAVA